MLRISTEKLIDVEDNLPVPIDTKIVHEVTSKIRAKESLQHHLNESGASLKDVARTVGNLMNYSSKDSTRLSAAQFAAQIHDAHTVQESGGVIFRFEGNQQINLLQLFNPDRK